MPKYRIEQKFYIDKATYQVIRQRLKQLVMTDPHSNDEGEYRIDSIYYDDYLLQAYEDKMAGVDQRFKFRVRTYDLNDSFVRLEKKYKSGDYVKKETVELTKELYGKMSNNEWIDFNEHPLLNQFGLMQRNIYLQPVCIVTYDREAYTVGETNIRVTFDKSLRTRLSDLDLFNNYHHDALVFNNDTMIMEVKYDSYLPSYLKGLLQVGHLQKQSISKYILCLDQRRKILFRS